MAVFYYLVDKELFMYQEDRPAHPRSQQPVELEMIKLHPENPERACIRLDNGLLLALPYAVHAVEDMGDYEWTTLAALETQEGMDFVMSELGSRHEVHLPLGPNWVTAASIYERGGEIVFSLYWGAK